MIESFWACCVFGVAAVVWTVVGRRRGSKESRRLAIDEAARELGLSAVRAHAVQWLGEVEGLPVELRFVRERSSSAPGFWVEVGGLPTGVTIGPRRTAVTEAGLSLARARIAMGVPAFDDQVDVRGDGATALALLGQHWRWPIARLMAGVGGSLEGGVLRTYQTPPLDQPLAIGASLRSVVDVALELRKRGAADRAAQLAENVQEEASWVAGLNNLRCLAARFPDDSHTVAAARSALKSPQPALRLEAALALGIEAAGEVARVACDELAAEELRLRAIEHLGTLPGARALELLGPLFGSGQTRFARAAIVNGAAADRDLMCAYLIERLPTASTAAAELWAEQLGALGGAGVVDALVGLLERTPEWGTWEVKLAAVRALAFAGRVDTVEHLVALRAAPGELGQAARQTIASIQSRLGDVEGGRLSVTASAVGGELSTVDEATGDLSLTPELDDDGVGGD